MSMENSRMNYLQVLCRTTWRCEISTSCLHDGVMTAHLFRCQLIVPGIGSVILNYCADECLKVSGNNEPPALQIIPNDITIQILACHEEDSSLGALSQAI